MRMVFRRCPSWGFLAGAVMFLIGLPGTVSDTLAWWGLLGGRFPYVLAIAGIVVMALSGWAALHPRSSVLPHKSHPGTDAALPRATAIYIEGGRGGEGSPLGAGGGGGGAAFGGIGGKGGDVVVQTDPGRVFDELVSTSDRHMLRLQLSQIDQLIRDGRTLRAAEVKASTPPDDLTRRFDPMATAIHAVSRQTRNMFSPSNVNAWLKRVAALVESDFPEHSGQIVRHGLGKSDIDEIVAAIDKDLVALRSIRSDLEDRTRP